MPEYEKTADECSHENLEYVEIDTCSPEAVYENWYCRDCGASIEKVLTVSYWLVHPSEGDSTEEHEVEVN